jgi:hypothetical protein
MTDDERHRKITEESEKERIVREGIEGRIEALGGQLRQGWKARLKAMATSELQQLAEDLQGAHTIQGAQALTIKAICDSEQGRRMAEYEKLDALGDEPSEDT